MERSKLFLTVSVLSCLSHGWEVQVPQSVKAVKGSCVMISCRTSSHSHVIWYKYKGLGYPVVYSRNTADIIAEFRGRTSVPGSPSQGDCSLKINSVRQEDNGISLYPWIYPETSSNQYKYIQINVVNPEISISVESPSTDGNLFSATCTVRHSCPSFPQPVKWEGLSDIYNKVISNTPSGGLWTSVTQAQFRANRLNHTRTLSCIFNGRSAAHTLNILYAPTDVKIDGADRSVVEGATVSLTCTSKSNPAPTHYEWLVTQKISIRNQTEQKIFNLGSVKRDTSVSCIARNSAGRGQSEPVLLIVHFPPTILMNSSCFVSAGGVRCVCQVEAEPKAKIFWMVDGSSAPLPHFNTTTQYTGRITVSELTGPPASNVSCKASNNVGTDTYQMPIQNSLSEGNSGSMVAAVVAVGCIILGIAVVAICLKKRRQQPADSTYRSRRDSSGKNIVVNLHDNIYANNAAGEDIYTNTMDTPQTNKDDGYDIYQNY
ncbi:B-cell receptor CD22-like [Colossoma macropomum]|uniref:B-cell receptor CD22-like n=1 Tax=Colossoma macropomum TaxID=42526 RepID=UPI00186441CF|nr:B-cell receptor CD22-like [Colossoma macropomum]